MKNEELAPMRFPSGNKMEGGPVSLILTKAGQTEEALLFMRYKRWFIILVMLFMLWCFWFFSFGTIVPYLKTGDFSEIWPAHKGSIGIKAIFLFSSSLFWIYSPAIVQLFRVGNVAFFQNHAEVKPYVGIFRNRTVKYDSMHIITRDNRAMILTNGHPEKWWQRPYAYWKAIYWQGIVVTMVDMSLKNPESLPQIIQMMRDRAITVTKF